MDQQDMTQDDEANTWPELSADVTLARSTARSITLDTQRASSDGRILEVTAQLELMRTRLSSLEQHVFDATADAGASEDLLSRFVSLDAEIAETTARFEGLASRVAAAEESVATTMMQSVDGFDARLVMVEDARSSQTTELNQLTSYLEQAFTRITELAEVIEAERVSNVSSRSEAVAASEQLDAVLNERFNALRSDFDDLTRHLEVAANSIDQSTAGVQEELAVSVRFLADRVSASEVRLDAVDEISSSIQFLQARAEGLENDTTSSAAAATSHRLEIVDHVDHAHTRIDETQGRIDEARNELQDLRTQISHPTEPAATPSDVDELRTAISTVAESSTSNTEAHRHNAEAIASTAEAVAENRTTISETGIAVSSATRLAQDALDRVGNIAENADLVGQRVDLVQAATEELVSELRSSRTVADNAGEKIGEIQQRVDQLAGGVESLYGKVDNAATALDAAHTRIDDAESASQDAHARIEEGATAVHERINDFTHAIHERLADSQQTVDARFDENQQAVDARFDENQQAVDARFDENRRAVDQRLDENQRTLHEQIEAASREIDELREAVETARAASSASASTEDELRRTNERIEAVSANINAVTTLLEETTNRFGDVDRNIEGVEERIDQSLELAVQARDRGDQISSRLDEQGEQLAQVLDAAASVADTAALNTDRLNEVEQDVASAQQRLEENLSAAAETTTQALELANGLQGSIDEIVDHRTSALEEHLQSRIDEARSNVQNVVFDSENKATQSREVLRREIDQRIDAVESGVLDRLIAVEDDSTTDVRLAAVETTLHTVEETLGEVEGLTKEAHAFSESLRLIQSDVVQTIQTELRTQTSQMETLDGRMAAAETASADFATAERVHMLEAKLVEALQTISQLTQLQRRNTTVEAQLTDTLTTTSRGVESTQNSIAALRQELELAQNRIAQLESSRAASASGFAATHTLPTTGGAAAIAPAVSDTTLGGAPEDHAELGAVDDDADTGWFTESYARKNQEPKAS